MTREPRIRKTAYKITKIFVAKLKGINQLEYNFGDHLVTAILGVNGCGKSTILHALACAYRPESSASKDYNRLSDFFKTNTDADWNGSEFKIYFEFKEQDHTTNPPAPPTAKNDDQTYSKQSQSWSPKYYRRPIHESTYIGLQNLQTGADNPNSYRYRVYETTELAHAAAALVKRDMIYILGRQYDRLNHHVVRKNNNEIIFWGLESGGIRYSELSMGSGEKRVLNILSALHHESFQRGGLLAIDELDALLHASSFKRLLETLINKSSSSRFPLQIVFTTHRETVAEFSEQINICSILNTRNRTLALPYIDPDVMMQLTGNSYRQIEIYVEDELSEDIINNLIFSMNASPYVHVKKFGAASNAFCIVAGKLLLGHDISSTICVLDGDVFLSATERESEIQRHLGGNDRAADRATALNSIKSYRLTHQLPQGISGAPEFNHKTIFETSSVNSDQLARLQNFSTQVIGLHDWHKYYNELARISGIRKCRDYILDHLSTLGDWDNYVLEIRTWLEEKLHELGYITTENQPEVPPPDNT